MCRAFRRDRATDTVSKPTQAEIDAALLSDDPALLKAVLVRVTRKRPAHKEVIPETPFRHGAMLGLFFGFLKNHDDIENLKAGVMPMGLDYDPEYAADLIARLSPVAAKNLAVAERMTADWLCKHNDPTKCRPVTTNMVKKAYTNFRDHLGVKKATPAHWEAFKRKQRKQFTPDQKEMDLAHQRWQVEFQKEVWQSHNKKSS